MTDDTLNAGSGLLEDDGIREKAMQIVRQMPRYAIGAVLSEVESTAANPARARALRSILIDHFNRLRPLKARRLFTICFEPLLIDDPVLLRAHNSVPGLFQRADVGGVWTALTRGPLQNLTNDVQKKLDDVAKDTLIERYYSTPAATAMRATMAREAAAHLDALPRHRKAFEEFLAIANREAMREAQRTTPCLWRKAPIDADMIALFIEILREGDPVRLCLQDLRTSLGKAPAGPGVSLDSQVSAVMDACHDIAHYAPERGAGDPVAWLPALLALNVHRRYDITLQVIRDYAGSATGDSHPLHWAAFCHFAASCNTIMDTLGAVFTRDVARTGQPIGMTRPIRALLRDAVKRFGLTLGLLGSGGLLAVRTIGPRLQPLLTETARTLDNAVIPVVSDRAHAALSAREGAVADHEDVIWVLGFLSDWNRELDTAGYATPEMDALRHTIMRDAEDAHAQALKLDNGEDPRRRMDHLVRINAVVGALGATIDDWANPMSQGMQTILRHHLRPGRLYAPEVEAILEGYVRAIRRELARSRHWQSAELTELVALYDNRLNS